MFSPNTMSTKTTMHPAQATSYRLGLLVRIWYVAAMEEFKLALLDTGCDGLADAVQGDDEEQ